jgi:hypothetical protein
MATGINGAICHDRPWQRQGFGEIWRLVDFAGLANVSSLRAYLVSAPAFPGVRVN